MKSKKTFGSRQGFTLSAISLSLLISGNVLAEPAQRLIIKYKDSLTQLATTEERGSTIAQSIRQSHGVSLQHVRKMALRNHHVLRLDQRQSKDRLNQLIVQLQKDPNILSVEEDILLKPNFVPNDQFYNLQWHYHEATGGMNAEDAWDTNTGAGVVVAVIDTGYTVHSDLSANLLPGYDFISDSSIAVDGDGRDNDATDEGDWASAGDCGIGEPASNSSWHGTHVAGTVAAVTDNGQGVAGVAYGANVVPVRVLGKCGGFTSDIADGIIWASGGSVPGVPANNNPAQVINMSLGGPGSCGSTTQNAIDTARANGTVVVVAAGNSNSDASGFNPASCNGVINVAANDREGNRASYSNFGANVDVTAPGGEVSPTAANGVASTLNSGTQSASSENYVYYQGTSMAAPHVAGAAALLLEADPTLTPDEVESTLKNTARALPGSCSGGCGTGIIDARAALDSLGTTTPGDLEVLTSDDFESGLGNWSNSSGNDSHDFTRDSNGTPSNSTGPNAGSNSTWYMYLETSSGNANSSGNDAILNSASISATDVEFNFDYHMYGSNIGTLSVDVLSGGSWINDVWSISGQQHSSHGASYTSASVDLSAYSVDQIRLRATAAGSWRGDIAFDNLEVLGTPGTTTPGGDFFENTTDFSIPDNNGTGIESPISVSRTGNSGTVTVNVNIVHTWIGDLIVDLIHPDGTVYNLHNRTGSSTDNINQDYSVNVGSKDSAGTWDLRVRDLANADTGHIDSWSVTF
ncbi:MAG: S8 family serine peptidase [Kangiellaceae bacterium]|nr:S8 family serine peptidase [Kangiellaceae bacterium]